MVNYEEKVFHPNLGICDVTGIDKKEKRMVITAADGSTCSIPLESLPRVGVRNLMESDEADLIMKKLFTPKTGIIPSSQSYAYADSAEYCGLQAGTAGTAAHWSAVLEICGR